MNNITVKIAGVDFVDDICLLDGQYEYERYSRNTIMSFLQSQTCRTYVAILDDELVGYITYAVVDDECELIKVVVEQGRRGCGIGLLLIGKTLDCLKNEGVEKVFLEVRINNLPAIKLYEKLGFKNINIRQKYYDNSVDALIYGKCLNVENKL